MSSEATKTASTDLHHLLGHPPDLAGHVHALGPLVLPDGHHQRRTLAASLEASGLHGRGGGDFPTSVKLAVASSAGRGGTVVVNAMEGEPASDKDKLLLNRTPHLVLDGAQYLAAMCRSSRVVVCVPTGREGTADAVAHAMAERRRSRYAPVTETLLRPPDRFVGGEETALVNFVESGSSFPVFRPDKGVPLRIGRRRGPRPQRGDPGARRPHRPTGPWTLPGSGARGGTGYLSRDDRWSGDPPRGGRGRPGHAAVGHCAARYTHGTTAGIPGGRLRRKLGRSRVLCDPVRLRFPSSHRCQSGRRRDRGVGSVFVWSGRDCSDRPLPGSSERRTVRALRLWAARYCRRPGASCTRPC